MVDVAARHEHALGVQLDVLAAHCAHRRFQGIIDLLTMLLFDFNNW